MFVVPKKIGAALDGRSRLHHFLLDVGIRLAFAGAIIPINRRYKMVGIRTRNNQLSDRSMPLSLAVGDSNFEILNSQEHITRLGMGGFPKGVDNAQRA